MMYRRLAALCLAVAVSASARAEDAMAILKKVDARMYHPQENGLKDLKVKVATEGPGSEMMGGLTITLYWKAPNKKACDIELPEELKQNPQMADMVRQGMQASLSHFTDLVVPERHEDVFKDYTYTAEADGDATKITGRRKADAKNKLLPEETVIWVDKTYTPVKFGGTENGKSSTVGKLTFEEKEGKLLLSTAVAEPAEGGSPGELKITYSQVGKVWIGGAVEIKQSGQTVRISFKDPAVNKGIDDKVFEAPKESAPKEPAAKTEGQGGMRLILNEKNAGVTLRYMVTHEALWRTQDPDRNGVTDYWTRDVAGFHCVHDAAGKGVGVIDLALARADAAPGMAYPELGGAQAPKQGYWFKAMQTDQDGNAYLEAALPAPTAPNAPAGVCTNQSHFGFCAYPARYGVDGVRTFIVDEDGVVWQKDLGPDAKGVDDRRQANPEVRDSGWSQFER